MRISQPMSVDARSHRNEQRGAIRVSEAERMEMVASSQSATFLNNFLGSRHIDEATHVRYDR